MNHTRIRISVERKDWLEWQRHWQAITIESFTPHCPNHNNDNNNIDNTGNNNTNIDNNTNNINIDNNIDKNNTKNIG